MDDPVVDAVRHAAANAERDAIVAAIREGLDDVKAGRIKPARAVLGRLARKYGLTAES